DARLVEEHREKLAIPGKLGTHLFHDDQLVEADRPAVHRQVNASHSPLSEHRHELVATNPRRPWVLEHHVQFGDGTIEGYVSPMGRTTTVTVPRLLPSCNVPVRATLPGFRLTRPPSPDSSVAMAVALGIFLMT